MGISLTRKEFYELLWKEPQTALAKQFGVSDSAIGKDARKAEIPRPGPGYWQKLKANKKVVPVPLPFRFPDASDWIYFGNKCQSESVTVDEDEIPQAPTYEESLEDVRERVVKIVGKVSCTSIGKSVYAITKKLLDQDDEREYEDYADGQIKLYGKEYVSICEKVLNGSEIFHGLHSSGLSLEGFELHNELLKGYAKLHKFKQTNWDSKRLH